MQIIFAKMVASIGRAICLSFFLTIVIKDLNSTKYIKKDNPNSFILEERGARFRINNHFYELDFMTRNVRKLTIDSDRRLIIFPDTGDIFPLVESGFLKVQRV